MRRSSNNCCLLSKNVDGFASVDSQTRQEATIDHDDQQSSLIAHSSLLPSSIAGEDKDLEIFSHSTASKATYRPSDILKLEI